ncbi:hypothetical protein IT157_08500 [bacterium]|nr:hypothetical protein [bacterium]
MIRANRHISVFIALLLCAGYADAQGKGKAAFLKSLVIPGWGQYELDRPRHALAFFATDLLLVGTALGLNHYGQSVREDYIAFAAEHAGVVGGHEKDFYADVGNWMNVYDYNDQRLADRNYSALYDTESEYWYWDSDHNRASMDEMRVKSERALNRVVYAVALVGVNHLVSAFHAGRLQKAQTKLHGGIETTQKKPVNLTLGPDLGRSGLGLSLTARW